MNGTKWIKIFFTLTVLSIGLLNIVNYIIDPFNIFHTKILKHQAELNERFVKIEYLEKYNKNFNGYMFGSSRIGTTSPKVIEKYIPNSKIYNFTISAATLYDYITHLKYFIKRKYPIDTLYLQIDIDSMARYGISSSDYLRKLHPYVLDNSLNLYYMSYLNGFFPSSIKAKILKNINESNIINYTIDRGTWAMPDKELDIVKNCKKLTHINKEFRIRNTRTVKYITSSKSMEALSEIVILSNKHNIKLYVFTMPHNKNTMDAFIIDEYLRYLREISDITNFYDFSGYNAITKNNCNYYDISHYRPLVGNIIAAKIFNDKSIEVPSDFGVFVSKNNIDEHLENLKKQINNYDLDKKLK